MAQRILITGGRAPAALALVRAFHSRGAKVFVAESCRFPVSRASACASRTFYVSSPRHNPAAFIQSLIGIIQEEKIELLIPTCEEVFYIVQALPELSRYCRVFTDGIEKLRRFHNKWEFSQLCRGLNIQAPETHLLASVDELNQWRNQSRSWVFKPVYSRFASRTLVRPEWEDLEKIQPSQGEPWVAQRYMAGVEYSSYSVCQEGRLLAHLTYYSKYRAGRGAGIFFEAVHQGEILEFTRQFVEAYSYNGQIAFDFRADAEGKLTVLECNPRATSGVHLFDGHLAGTFCKDGQGLTLPDVRRPRMLGLLMPLYGLGQGKAVKDFLGDWLTAEDVVFSWKDPAPFVYQLLSFGEMLQRCLRHRVSLLEAATMDIEWNGC